MLIMVFGVRFLCRIQRLKLLILKVLAIWNLKLSLIIMFLSLPVMKRMFFSSEVIEELRFIEFVDNGQLSKLTALATLSFYHSLGDDYASSELSCLTGEPELQNRHKCCTMF